MIARPLAVMVQGLAPVGSRLLNTDVAPPVVFQELGWVLEDHLPFAILFADSLLRIVSVFSRHIGLASP